jgi:hypothetical protein
MKLFSTLPHELTSGSNSLLCGLAAEAGYHVGKTRKYHRIIMTHLHLFTIWTLHKVIYVYYESRRFSIRRPWNLYVVIQVAWHVAVYISRKCSFTPLFVTAQYVMFTPVYMNKGWTLLHHFTPSQILSAKPWSRKLLVHLSPHSTKSPYWNAARHATRVFTLLLLTFIQRKKLYRTFFNILTKN